MTDRFGSHWRWRVAMALIAIALISYGWWQAGRWKGRALVELGGGPAVFRTIHRDGSQSIRAFDWKSGRWWTIATFKAKDFPDEAQNSLLATPQGDAIVWLVGLSAHKVDIQPPHQSRTVRYSEYQSYWDQLKREPPSPYQVSYFARNPDGTWRFVNAASPARFGANVYPANLMETFPGLKLECYDDERLALFHIVKSDTKELWTINRHEVSGLRVDKANAVIVTCDRYDDIVVQDIRTGNVVAREWSGSSRRLQLVAVGLGLLIVALVWTRIAIAETVLGWGMLDALAVSLLIQVPIHPIRWSCESTLHNVPLFRACRAVQPADFLEGGMVGAAILAGWYLAHGRQWIAIRWLLGTLGVSLFAVPLYFSLQRRFLIDPEMEFRTCFIFGLFVFSLSAAAAVLSRPLGWTVCTPDDRPSPWRFGINAMLTVVFAVSAAIILFQSLPLYNDIDFLVWSVGAIVLGIPLVGVLFLKSRWIQVSLAAALLAMTAAAIWWRAVNSGHSPTSWTSWTQWLFANWFFVNEAIATLSAALTILIPCLVLRKHGWSWTRIRHEQASLDQPASSVVRAAA